ncbi:hypothetical protein R6Q57_020852 [Mikania cordata]
MVTPISSPNTHLFSTSCQIAIRIVAGATSIAAAGLLFNSRQSEVLFGTNVDARYSYTPALKYYTIINVVACACSLLSLLPVFILGRKFSNPANFFLLFLHDLMIAIFLAAGCGAATTIAQVGKHGNSHAGWMPICDNFGKFCHKIVSSLVFGYIALFCYVVLAILSASKARQILV